jgi:hypothetical protein
LPLKTLDFTPPGRRNCSPEFVSAATVFRQFRRTQGIDGIFHRPSHRRQHQVRPLLDAVAGSSSPRRPRPSSPRRSARRPRLCRVEYSPSSSLPLQPDPTIFRDRKGPARTRRTPLSKAARCSSLLHPRGPLPRAVSGSGVVVSASLISYWYVLMSFAQFIVDFNISVVGR